MYVKSSALLIEKLAVVCMFFAQFPVKLRRGLNEIDFVSPVGFPPESKVSSPLLLISFLMLLGTLGVMKFGNTMFEDINATQMQPRGEKVKL